MTAWLASAKLAEGLTEVSAGLRLAGALEVTASVVQPDADPFADRQVVAGPELHVTVRRACCVLTVRAPLGQGFSGAAIACPHQRQAVR